MTPPGAATRPPWWHYHSAVFWAGAGILLVTALWWLQTPLSNDGVQYLSGARNLLDGHGFATSILYFDEHYRFGTIPAPQTVWPPGYSALIAPLGMLGLDLEAAGRLVDRVAYVLLLPLVMLLARRVTQEPTSAAIVTLWVFGITELWLFTATPNSEMPFLVLSLAALVSIPRHGAPPWQWLAPGLLAASAAGVRYAGAFLILALGLVAIAGVVVDRAREGGGRTRAIAWYLLGTLPFAAILLRNLLLVGSLQGGNSKPVAQAVGGLLTETTKALADLLGGVALIDLRAGGLRAVAAGVGIAGLLFLVTLALRGLLRVRAREVLRDPVLLALWIYPMVYVPVLIWTASRTMLTYGGRYLLPIAPLLALLVVQKARGSSRPGSGRHRAVVAALVAVLLAQGVSLGRRVSDRRVEGWRPDQMLTDWVAANLAPGDPVMVVGSGQLVGHHLNRPTAAVPHTRFTAELWDASTIADRLEQYGIRTIVALRNAGPGYGPFADALRSGAVPAWLELVTETPSYSVYRRIVERSGSRGEAAVPDRPPPVRLEPRG